MASNAAQNTKPRDGSSSKNGVTPEEEQLQRALKHLDLLLVRSRDIRTTIPRMLSDMPIIARNNQDSPEVLFHELVNGMKKAGTEIQDFTTLYTSEESKKVLEQARKSHEANPTGIKTWRYKDHPDWADVAR
ncbi:hypothetical protein F4861DRAFT_492696 [Xylaria intraflava]|nr:hypothetical protein F4861DRAFT_492696 [Xylaria intraflava]